MKNVIYNGNELHTIISQAEMKQMLHDKYGFPIENISVSGAEMWVELNLKRGVNNGVH